MKSSTQVSFNLDYNEELFQFINNCTQSGEEWIEIQSASSGKEAIVLNNPAWVKHILQTNNKNYIKGIGIDKISMLLGNGIMVSEGAHWLRQRRMVQTCFHRNFLKTFFAEIVRLNEGLINRWMSQRETQIDLNKEMSQLSLNAILSAIFSEDIDIDSNATPFHVLVEETTRDLRFAKKFRGLHGHVDAIVESRRREDRWPDDFLSALVNVKNKEDGLTMTRHELNDEVITLIVAGHETTASSLTWCWYLLMTHETIYERMINNVGSILSSDFDAVMKLEMPRKIIQEAMRLYPAGWLISRKALQDDWLDNQLIKAGTDVLLSLYALHRHPAIWTDPNEFNPDRFTDQPPMENAHLPFSTGPRKCIGDSLALLEMQTHLALVSRRLRLSIKSGQTIKLEPLINLRPKDPIYVTTTTLN